jgi:hypothetical protein
MLMACVMRRAYRYRCGEHTVPLYEGGDAGREHDDDLGRTVEPGLTGWGWTGRGRAHACACGLQG